MKIDKGIPMPEARGLKERKHHKVYELVEKMQIGDSFLADETVVFKGCFSTRCHLEKKYGIKLAQRKTAEGIRVWRTA